MSITDELRKWAHGFNGPWKRNEEMLLAIADRIDAEHEAMEWDYKREFDEWKHDRDARWVKLPVDADGVPIHVGDSIEVIGGEDGMVVAIELSEGGWDVSMRPTGWDTPTMFSVESVRHHHAPTVEDVLRKLIHRYDELRLGLNAFDPFELIAEFAAKLRLAEEVDG